MNTLLQCKRKDGGFTLVELLVGIVVGLLTVLAITESFSMFEGRKRTSIGGATAEENGILASFLIERDVRMAGFGMNNASDCSAIRFYSATASPTTVSMTALSVTITQNTSSLKNPASATEGTDTIEITYSGAAHGNVYGKLQKDMADSDPTTPLRVASGIGIKQYQMFMIYEPGTGKDCSILQASADSTKAEAENVTNKGQQWDIPHASGVLSPYNPPAGSNIFPPTGYKAESGYVANMGSIVQRRYYISSNNLMVDELITTGGSAGTYATQTLVSGIVSLKAHYGSATGTSSGHLDPATWGYTPPSSVNDLVALRIGLLARSGVPEKDPASASSLAMWPGGPNATGLDTYYRYKNFYTTIPLRNAIWNNNP